MEKYTKAFSEGPWVIYRQYLTVQPWSTSFLTAQSYPHQVVVWISLPEFSGALYKKCLLQAVDGTIGHVIKIDENRDNGARGLFARMTVNVDLRQSLVSKIRIEGKVQRTEYEGLPNVCFECGIFGYAKEVCPEVRRENPPAHDDEAYIVVQNLALEVLDRRAKVESYGSWMIVARKSRHPLRKNEIREDNVIGESNKRQLCRDHSFNLLPI